jgi:hypothetical protein
MRADGIKHAHASVDMAPASGGDQHQLEFVSTGVGGSCRPVFAVLYLLFTTTGVTITGPRADVAPAWSLDRENIGAGHAKGFPKSAMTAPSEYSRLMTCAGDEQLEKRRVFIVPK